MADTPAFARAADIVASLELLAERCPDPAPVIYRRMFETHPQMEPYFWRDKDGAIRGEMLARTIEAILDFVGERRYAGHMIGTEMVTHEGYMVQREVFITFFTIIRDSAREILADEWSAAFETAWAEMLAEIAAFVNLTPRSDVDNAFYAKLKDDFEHGQNPLPA
jgi:hemoglobin-like flavoprotein